MPNDDFERFRKFMMDQQAQFWADLRAMEERQAEHRAEHERATREWEERFRRFHEETEERFTTLVDVCMSLARHGEETDRRIRELGEETHRRFQDTDYKLNALIDTVDKLIKRNGSHQ